MLNLPHEENKIKEDFHTKGMTMAPMQIILSCAFA